MNNTPDTRRATEAAYRTAGISDLRALADMLENEPALPMPLAFSCAVYLPRGTETDGPVAEVFAVAEKLDTEVTYDRSEGRVETAWVRGCVRYSVYTRTPRPDETVRKIKLTSPQQVPGADAPTQPETRNGEQRGSAA